MAFDEHTYVHLDDSREVYVDRDVETGRIVDLYTYPSTRERHFPASAWVAGRNPLFVHAAHPAQVYASMVRRGDFVCSDDPWRKDG